MFSIRFSSRQEFDIVTLTDESSKTKVDIIPSCGALLHAFTVLQNEIEINVVSGHKNRQEFDESFEATGFKSAKLSPFVCRLKNGSYEFGEKKYRIEKFYLGENAIHGLLYDKPFTILSQQSNAENASLELWYAYRGEDAGYPFHYDCKVTYSLSAGNRLSIRTDIINKDAGIIPVADGWHPYFSFGKKIDECQLEFQSKEMLEFDAALIPTGKLLPYQEFGSIKTIGNQFFDNCFTVNFAECQPMLVFRDPAAKLQLEISPDKSYPYLQIYTPPQRESIAFENLSAAPDAFNNGMGLITLKKDQSASFTTTYQLRSLHEVTP